MNRIFQFASRAAVKWGEGLVTAEDLVAGIPPCDRQHFTECGAEFWKPYAVMYRDDALGIHHAITDPGWQMVAQQSRKQNARKSR